MNPNLSLTQRLHAQNRRITPQRLAVLKVIDNAEGHLTAAEIYPLAAREIPGITEATIYRTLGFLTSQGLILRAHMGSGRIVYESRTRAHHHLVCRKCGDSVDLPESLLQDVYRQVEEKYGFLMDSTHSTLFGLCPNCRLIEEEV